MFFHLWLGLYRFLEAVKEEPKLLQAAIVSEAESDKKFQEDLERLVNRYQQLQNTSNVSQTTESGVNQNVNNNSGTVIGQQTPAYLAR